MCGEDGCLKSTRESKPFCSLHLSRMPYAGRLMADLDAQGEELQRIRTKGSWTHIDPRGSIAEEVFRCVLGNGPRTLERLSRDCNLGGPEVAMAYMKSLRRAKRVKSRRNGRRKTVVYIPESKVKASA